MEAEAEADDESVKPENIEVEIKPLCTTLREVFFVFGPLGVIAFGGPAAYIGVLHTQSIYCVGNGCFGFEE